MFYETLYNRHINHLANPETIRVARPVSVHPHIARDQMVAELSSFILDRPDLYVESSYFDHSKLENITSIQMTVYPSGTQQVIDDSRYALSGQSFTREEIQQALYATYPHRFL